jgi:hypothetical protein
MKVAAHTVQNLTMSRIISGENLADSGPLKLDPPPELTWFEEMLIPRQQRGHSTSAMAISVVSSAILEFAMSYRFSQGS